MSLCACCFFPFLEKEQTFVSAAETSQNCYYLLKSENTPYLANQAVGTIEGSGEFVVGTKDLVLTATANKNYQLVGWQVTYNEQSDSTEFYGIDNLTENSKTIKLSPEGAQNDDERVSATLTYFEKNGYFTSGTFALSQVFEDLTIVPVFDHIYYKVNINELVAVSPHENKVEIDGGVNLFYKTKIENLGETTYEDSYIQLGGNYYYYGDVKTNGTDYYTVHNTLEETPTEQKVDVSLGAFRFGDKPTIDFDVNIKSNIHESTNIDMKGASLEADQKIVEFAQQLEGVEENCFSFSKDEHWKRTTNYEIIFNIQESQEFLNTLKLSYHNLYVVDLDIVIDGSNTHSKHDEILDELSIGDNDITGNVSFYNFYSKLPNNHLQFLVKNEQDNSSRAFGIASVTKISKTIDGESYGYYDFESLNSLTAPSKYFGSISSNMVVTLSYTSIQYTINFKVCEQFVENLDVKFKELEGDCLEQVMLKRGDAAVELTAGSVKDLSYPGYEFVGFTFEDIVDIKTPLTYVLDLDKPKSVTILICYTKTEYTIALNNFNQVSIDGGYALKSITFTKTGATQTTETLTANMLAEKYDEENEIFNPYSLTIKMKLGDKLSISHLLNNGFDVLGYNLSATPGDYIDFTQFELTTDFITQYNITGENLDIYIHESLIKYTITYFIKPTEDTDLDEDVIMANLSVEGAGVLTKFTLNNQGEYVEINEANANLTADVAKIEISNLVFGEVVTLKSSAVVVNKGLENEYSYVFNWFTEDDKSTLLHTTTTVGETTYYNHEERVTKSRSVKVVYSMPNTKILFALDEEYANLEHFSFNMKVSQNDQEIVAVENGSTYVVEIQEVLVEISDVVFGYEFIGYQIGQSITPVNNLSFKYTPTVGVETITLKFSRIGFNFYFSQHSDKLNGQLVKFGEADYVELNIDKTSVEFEKPAGYYVALVRFGEPLFDGYSSILKESNADRNNNNILTYSFNLSRDQFTYLVSSLGVENKDGVVQVFVRIDYLQYSYEVSVQYGLMNPHNDSRDGSVVYPHLSLTYTVGQETKTILTDINADDVATFSGIPYNASVRLDALSGTPTGLSFSGWRFANDDVISQENYTHSSEYIILGNILRDFSLGYKFSYIAYTIHIDYAQGQGNPSVEINDQEVEGHNIQVTLFDKVEISANPIRQSGYKFKSITYYTPNYVLYEYNEENWATDYLKLYYINRGNYVLNTTEVYDDSVQYYYYQQSECVITDTDKFEDAEFIASDYALDGKKITIKIEYELLQLSINNNIVQTGDGSLTGRGRDAARIEIALEDFLIISMVAKNKGDDPRELKLDSTVTFHDIVAITVKINNAALNTKDGSIYDLTNGLKLITVHIGGKMCGFTTVGAGEYLIEFNVGQHMPMAVDVIDIQYTTLVESKTIYATTIIRDSSEFYSNTTMRLDADIYGFGGGETQDSAGHAFVEHAFQFLAKANIMAGFGTNEYKENFEISGVEIYCDGVMIDESLYEEYKIIADKTIIEGFETIIVTTRLMYDLKVVYTIRPKITFNGGPNYIKPFLCDNDGDAKSQKLTVGNDSESNIQFESLSLFEATIKYQPEDGMGPVVDEVKNCGKYNVFITFSSTKGYEWVEEIEITDDITLTINPKNLYLKYDPAKIAKTSKVYDGSSDWDPMKIYPALYYSDSPDGNSDFKIQYSSIIESMSTNLMLGNSSAFTTTDGLDGRVSKANEGLFYNVYMYDFKLSNNTFNKNFNLVTEALEITNYVQITKMPITLTGIKDYVVGKVYDGTDKAELLTTQYVGIERYVSKDDLKVIPENLVLKFDDYTIGTNKTVTVNTTNVLDGADKDNYYITDLTVKGLTIYPYSLSKEIEGVGTIQIFNQRGLTEKDKIDLIPLNAALVVEPIYFESVQYAHIYKYISKYLRGNNKFAVGYKLSMIVNGETKPVNNNLYLSLPNVQHLTGAYFLTGEETGEIQSSSSDGNIIIDLKQVGVQLDTIFTTQKRVYLKAWQIILIVLLCVSIIAAIVLVFIIVRKRKTKEYSVHDKI